jgi:methionyl-tRNA synthetase
MENVQFNDWQKLDLRVGEILEVEDIEGADKLYKLTINLGTEKRTLVAGIKEFYSKEELKARKCVVFTNLEPKTLRGIESKGMVLAAVAEELLQPDTDIEVGSKVC